MNALDQASHAEESTVAALPNRVLLLASDPDRASRLETVLDFLECQPTFHRTLPEMAVDCDQGWLAWVVSGCLGEALEDLLNELPERSPGIPVVLVGDDSEFPSLRMV